MRSNSGKALKKKQNLLKKIHLSKQKTQQKKAIDNWIAKLYSEVLNWKHFSKDDLSVINPLPEDKHSLTPDQLLLDPECKQYAEELYIVHALHVIRQWSKIVDKKEKKVFYDVTTSHVWLEKPNPLFVMDPYEFVVWAGLYERMFLDYNPEPENTVGKLVVHPDPDFPLPKLDVNDNPKTNE